MNYIKLMYPETRPKEFWEILRTVSFFTGSGRRERESYREKVKCDVQWTGGVSTLPLALACFLHRKTFRHVKQSPDDHRVMGKYVKHSLVDIFHKFGKLWWDLCKNLTLIPSLYHGWVVRERAGRHWWVKNAGFKLVVGKINFRAKKIGGSRKVNWWVRNFCPFSLPPPPTLTLPFLQEGTSRRSPPLYPQHPLPRSPLHSRWKMLELKIFSRCMTLKKSSVQTVKVFAFKQLYMDLVRIRSIGPSTAIWDIIIPAIWANFRAFIFLRDDISSHSEMICFSRFSVRKYFCCSQSMTNPNPGMEGNTSPIPLHLVSWSM